MNFKGDHVFSFNIDANHPACNGHFEGNPLLPGAVTLEYVRIAFKKMYPERQIRAFSKVKFTHLLRPGETLDIHFTLGNAGAVLFQCLDSKNHQIAFGNLLAS